MAQLQLINGALMGTGIQSFSAILNYFESKLKIKNVIIIAISNDFKRGGPSPWDTDTPCFQLGICGPADYWHPIEQDASESALIEDAQRRRSEVPGQVRAELARYSFASRLYDEWKSVYEGYQNPLEYSSTLADHPIVLANFNALLDIYERFPNLQIILVPQRDEVGLLGKRNADSRVVQSFLERENIEYMWCSLTSQDFMEIDGHPNKQGYQKLFECLRSTIIDNFKSV